MSTELSETKWRHLGSPPLRRKYYAVVKSTESWLKSNSFAHCSLCDLRFICLYLWFQLLYFNMGIKLCLSVLELVAAAAAKSLQSCPTLYDPIDGSTPGSAVPGILQARTLERVAISFSNALKWKVKVKSLSRARLLVTPWTAAYQAPPSMGFSRQEYWSGVPLPSPKETAKYYMVLPLFKQTQ